MKMGFFERILYLIKGAESTVVELIAVLGPWLAPAVPAYLTYYHSNTLLQLPQMLSLVAGAVVEVIGLASGHTLAQLWSHNKKYRANKDKVPLLPVWGVFSFYVLNVLIINLVLQWDTTTWQEKMAFAGLTLLTVPAIVIIAVRSQHTAILFEKVSKEANKKNKKQDDLSITGVPFTLDALETYYKENGISPFDVGRDGTYSPKGVAEATGWNASSVRAGTHKLRNNGR